MRKRHILPADFLYNFRFLNLSSTLKISLLLFVFYNISFCEAYGESAADRLPPHNGTMKAGEQKNIPPRLQQITRGIGEQINANTSKEPQIRTELNVAARMTATGAPILRGLQWHIYGVTLDLDNKPPLIAQSQEGSAKFLLKPGDYIVLVTFGRAERSKKITLKAHQPANETFILNAGGVKLNALIPSGKMNKKQLHFSIYAEGQINEQTPLIDAISPQEIVRLPIGLYHAVCTYGTANAVARTDIRIEAGKLLEVTLQQRAAQIILKLVRQAGGEALADTSWAVMNDSGDIVKEIVNANAYIILAEGNYVAIARNKEKTYQKEFSVSSGKDAEIELLATVQNSVDEEGID